MQNMSFLNSCENSYEKSHENTYKINIDNRDYSKWHFIPELNDSTVIPLTLRLFDGDIFIYENPCIIVESPVRSAKEIAGILLLENNRTYGRASRNLSSTSSSSKKSRLFYKCIPNNPRLPAFLVPYEIAIGFSKKFVNKYVTFKFKEWTIEQTHPVGTLVETIGDVTHLPAYCEYRLCTRELRYSITAFTQFVKTQIKEKILN